MLYTRLEEPSGRAFITAAGEVSAVPSSPLLVRGTKAAGSLQQPLPPPPVECREVWRANSRRLEELEAAAEAGGSSWAALGASAEAAAVGGGGKPGLLMRGEVRGRDGAGAGTGAAGAAAAALSGMAAGAAGASCVLGFFCSQFVIKPDVDFTAGAEVPAAPPLLLLLLLLRTASSAGTGAGSSFSGGRDTSLAAGAGEGSLLEKKLEEEEEEEEEELEELEEELELRQPPPAAAAELPVSSARLLGQGAVLPVKLLMMASAVSLA